MLNDQILEKVAKNLAVHYDPSQPFGKTAIVELDVTKIANQLGNIFKDTDVDQIYIKADQITFKAKPFQSVTKRDGFSSCTTTWNISSIEHDTKGIL